MSVKEDKLNKELCNLCNIQPKVIQDYELNDIELYVDFFEPVNFVKLMELSVEVNLPEGKVDAFLGETITTNVNSRFFDRESFIELLIAELKEGSEDPLMTKFRKRIKHARWEY